jgi:hypothetical protein
MGLACSASNANWGKCELGKTNSETVLPALQVQTTHKTLNCATKINLCLAKIPSGHDEGSFCGFRNS